MIATSGRYRRNLYGQICALVTVIALGLNSRESDLFPACFGKYPGDALWALMVFFLWGIVLPTTSTLRIAAFALATSYADEFSQLYQAQWINSLRGTPLGHLILGSAFHAMDLVAYLAGVFIGMIYEWLFIGVASAYTSGRE